MEKISSLLTDASLRDVLRVETRPISCYLIDLSADVRAGFCDAHRSQIRTISERLQRLV